MHCDMLKIQDGGAIVEKVNCDFIKKINFHSKSVVIATEY